MSNKRRITVQVNNAIADYDTENALIKYSECTADDLKDLIEALQAVGYLLLLDTPLTF